MQSGKWVSRAENNQIHSNILSAVWVFNLILFNVYINILGYLFNVGKAATQQVVSTAQQMKSTVEEKVENVPLKFMLGDCPFSIPFFANIHSEMFIQ